MFAYIRSIIFIFILLSTIIVAQSEKSIKHKTDDKEKINSNNSSNSKEAIGETISFKNETGNSILTITDEGNNAASLTIPSVGIPFSMTSTQNKLYNVGGILNFNGIALGSIGATSIDDLSDAKFDGNNLFLGLDAGNNNTAVNNTDVGFEALLNNTSGMDNTAIGYQALKENVIASHNTAVGAHTLSANISGEEMVAIGNYALTNNTTGTGNTSIGEFSLRDNSTGSGNVAIGSSAMTENISGRNNTAVGLWALRTNKIGERNCAFGYKALDRNTTGNNNVATGSDALYYNNDGNNNTSSGFESLYNNTIGDGNTGMGYHSLYFNVTGNYNTAFGYNSGTSSSTTNLENTTCLGYNAKSFSDNTVRIGNISVTSIGGYVEWSNLSDGRFKRNIQENISGLDFIMGLRPVSYNMDYNAVSEKLGENKRIENKDIKGTDGLASAPSEAELAAETYMKEVRDKKSAVREVGFIAQEVEELVNKLGIDFNAVERPENEQSMYRLRYSEFVVPLVKAVQEQQAIIQNLTKRIEELESRK